MIVYTGIFNRYDRLTEPCVVNDEVEYICFTDDPELTSDAWDIRQFSNVSFSPAEKNRFVKMFPHLLFEDSNADVSLYVDGNIQVLSDPREHIESVADSPIAAPRHPERSTIDEEVERLDELDRVNSEQAKRQLERYRKEGFTNQVPLTDNCILVRDHSNQNLQNAMTDWWDEYLSGVARDQIGLGYVLWKHDISLQLLGHYSDYWLIPTPNQSFRLHPHRPSGLRQTPWAILVSIRSSCSTSLSYTILYLVGTLLLSLKTRGITRTCKIWNENMQ